MKVVFAVGIITLIGLLGYLTYVQSASQTKKIKTLNSSVVELQGQVKELQKQVNNNVSFGTQQSLDALIHQIESEIDNQTEPGASESASQVPQTPGENQSGGMLMDEANDVGTMGSVEGGGNTDNDELYQELESELTNVFESEDIAVSETMANVELVEEEPICLIDNEFDDEEDDEEEDDEEEDDEEEDDEEDAEDAEDADEEEEDDSEDDESEIGEDNVTDLQNEIEDDFMEKLNDFYLSKTQAELRSLCQKHKKPLSGNKQTLVTRILQVDKLRNVTLE
jgi:hypothetical protein